MRVGGSQVASTYHGETIAGTVVFTGARSHQGYRINKLAMSLTDPGNREAFRANERAYMAKFGLTEAETGLVGKRDWTGLVEAGGSIYLLLKIAATVGQNLLQIGAQMRGETLDDFMAGRPGKQGAAVERKG
jgi:protocatechuate 4,5-dioxygenase alpha chain